MSLKARWAGLICRTTLPLSMTAKHRVDSRWAWARDGCLWRERLRQKTTPMLRRLTKTLQCTPKHVTKVSHQNEICKPKVQHEKATIQLSSCSKCCPFSQTRVLVDILVDDAVLQFSPDGDEALHWKPFYSVLLSYWNILLSLWSEMFSGKPSNNDRK